MNLVYLADLRHNWGGVISTDCMPLGIGYMKAVMDRDLPGDVESRLFAYPADLIAAIDERPPDVLMVSNYVWNESLGRQALRRLKRRSPRALTIMGGPNIPVEPDRQIDFVRERPEIDLYVLGEGDLLARDILRGYLNANCDRDDFLEQAMPSVVRRTSSGILRTEQAKRSGASDLNDIPSPWLTGVMDPFFDGRLAPLYETNRGCPFSCSFCVQGTEYYTKITQFSLDRIREEIDYMGRMIRTKSPNVGTLRIADANYGMYPRDTDISGYIGKAQLEYGWPTFIDATTGKNRAENVIRSMEQVHGGMVLYQSVQSLDEDVLRNVKRSNIKLSAYAQLAVHVRGRGLRSSTDLILALPGDSLTTHLKTLRQMIDAGTDQAHCFQAMMLKGSEMESVETRSQFGLVTRFRLGPKNFGEYGTEKVFDLEEIVVTSDKLPFEDYLQARKFHMTFSVYWNDSWFRDVTDSFKQWGITNFEWLTALLEAMAGDDGVAGKMLRDFEAETRGELFESEEACLAFYTDPERFDLLSRGQIGDNLMYKYRALASFFFWPDVCRLAMAATFRLLLRRHPGSVEGMASLWEDFTRFIEARHAFGSTIGELTKELTVTLRYNIPEWIAAGTPLEAEPYRLPVPTAFVFRLSNEGAEELENALAVWSSKAIGLSKLIVRIRHTAQVRDWNTSYMLQTANAST